jgi:hypothetical protein
MTPDKLIEPEWLFPFSGMQVKDSFFIPTLRPAEMIYALDSGAKRAGIRVKCFVTDKDGYIGVRAWRVA